MHGVNRRVISITRSATEAPTSPSRLLAFKVKPHFAGESNEARGTAPYPSCERSLARGACQALMSAFLAGQMLWASTAVAVSEDIKSTLTVLTADRRTSWNPGMMAAGGVPERTTICARV